MPGQTATPVLPTGRDRTMMLVTLMGVDLVAGFSETMMNIALPTVAKTYGIALTEANWVTLTFTIAAAAAIITSAAILHRFGLRKTGFIGLGASALGALVGLLAFDFPMLLVSRALQAVCVGMYFPVATAAILVLAPKEKTGALISLNSLMIGAGTALGPFLSGVALDALGIHGMYVLPLVATLGMSVLALRFLHDIFPRRESSFDPLSLVLGVGGLAVFIFGLSRITKDLVPGIICMAVGAVVLATFAWRQLHLKTPLLDLAPLKHPRFAVGIALVIMGMGSNACISLLMPLYYEGACGFTSFLAGLMTFIPLMVYSVMDYVGGRLFDKHGFWPLVTIGFACILACFITLALVAGSRSAWVMMAISCFGYFGIGLAYPPTKVAELKPLPATEDGEGSAFNSVSIQLANSIGQALFVGLLSLNVDGFMARGLSEAEAYAKALPIPLLVAAGMAVIAIIVTLVYVRMLRKDPATRPIAGYNHSK